MGLKEASLSLELGLKSYVLGNIMLLSISEKDYSPIENISKGDYNFSLGEITKL